MLSLSRLLLRPGVLLPVLLLALPELSLPVVELPLLLLLGLLPVLLPGVLELLSGGVAADGLDGGEIGVVLGGALAIGLDGVVVVLGGVDELRPQPASAAMTASAIRLGTGR